MDTIDQDRGTGRTTKQIMAAPYGAIYVWPVSHNVNYFNNLCMCWRRQDLQVRFPSALDYIGELCSTPVLTGIVIDHGCRLTDRQLDNLAIAEQRIK
jgi:hypothetical protein